MSVATEILNQLGANRFVAFTGAHTFVGGADYLMFALPPCEFKKDGISRVLVRLNPNDTYSLEFHNMRRKVTLVRRIDETYCDQLCEIFTEVTGLIVPVVQFG